MNGTFTPPTVDWLVLAPVTSVMLIAIIGVLVEAFAPRNGRRWVQVGLALVGLVLALFFLTIQWGGPPRPGLVMLGRSGEIGLGMQSDPITLFLQAALVVMGGLSILTLADHGTGALDSIAAAPATRPDSHAERAAERAGRQTTEVFPLTMFAIGGMMIFVSASDLLTIFVALEVFSLPLYIMCGLARHQRLKSQEASLKYFLLGAFSSAIFLFGLALMYGAVGTVNLNQLTQAVGGVWQQSMQQGQAPTWPAFVILASVLMLAGLLFKVGAVPFHSWTPDVYDGAPTPVTGFMAACVKAAGFGVLLRLLLAPVQTPQGLTWPGLMWFFEGALEPALVLVAALTMVVGSVVAIRQTDVKRMLGYSAVAHGGFILCGLVSFQAVAVRGVLFYLVVYGLSSIAAFGLVSMVRVRNADGSIGPEAKNLDQWDGLGRRSPVVAAAFSLLMLAFAGFPLTSGFIAKFGVFSAAVATQKWPLVALAVLGVITSAVSASFYLRVIVRMYFSDATDSETSTVVVGGGLTAVAIGVGVLATIVFGLQPGPLLDAAGAMLVVR